MLDLWIEVCRHWVVRQLLVAVLCPSCVVRMLGPYVVTGCASISYASDSVMGWGLNHIVRLVFVYFFIRVYGHHEEPLFAFVGSAHRV